MVCTNQAEIFSLPGQRRRIAKGLSDEERKIVRQYSRENPSIRKVQLQDWIQEQFGIRPSRTTIYRLFSETYDYLDSPRNVYELERRKRGGYYPDIEEALYEWEKDPANLNLTESCIRAKAMEVWGLKYLTRKPPVFSSHWVLAYRKRRDVYFEMLEKEGKFEAVARNSVKEEGSVAVSKFGKRVVYSKHVQKRAVFEQQPPDAKNFKCETLLSSRTYEAEGKDLKAKIEVDHAKPRTGNRFTLNHDEKLTLADPLSIHHYIRKQWALSINDLVKNTDKKVIFFVGKISYQEKTVELRDITLSASKVVIPGNDLRTMFQVNEVE